MSERDADKWGKTLGDVLDALLWCHETHCPRACSPGDRVMVHGDDADHPPAGAHLHGAVRIRNDDANAEGADQHVLPSEGHTGR